MTQPLLEQNPPSMAPQLGTARVAADHLVDAMERFGIKAAFGVTGGSIGTVFDRLCRSKTISVYHGQHECGAAYSALGRAVATRGKELVACFATAGPGATNLITGVAAAHQEGVPLLVITGNSSTLMRGKGALQDSYPERVDVVGMFESITVANETITDPNELCTKFQQFAEMSLRLRKPVHLNIPLDISNTPLLDAEPSESPPMQLVAYQPWLPCELGALQDFLAAARPLVFAGNGVKLSGAAQLLREVAERHNLPVLTTTHGRGGLSEECRCYFGSLGFAAAEAGPRFLEDYAPTAILFLGSGLGEMATAGRAEWLGRPGVRIHVDLDAAKFRGPLAPTATIQRDLVEVLHHLAEQPTTGRRLPTVPRQSLVRQKTPPRDSEALVAPASVFQRVGQWLGPRDAVFFEMGSTMAWGFKYLPLHQDQELYASLGLAAMGSGLCAALGAATHFRDRDVFCIAGDCATLMCGNELKTAVEYDIPLRLIVINDGGHGMVHHGSRMVGLSNTEVRFRQRVDFAAYARSLGAAAFSIRTTRQWHEFSAELLTAQVGPVLLDVWIDESIAPPIADRARVVECREAPERISAPVSRAVGSN